MSVKEMIGLVGGGVIGAGWAARFLLDGHDCAVFDPAPELARKLDAVMGDARRARARLMPGAAVPEGRLRVAASVADAVGGATFVVESVPEVEALKLSVLGEIDAAAQPDTVVASSTSGLLPTRLAAGMAHPERLVVGHPFDPVYLLPLVELCGGERTAEGAQDRAAALYESVGMRVLRLRKEVDGFVANRLLEAVRREALWLVEGGVATTEEIDDAIRFGAGLRWSCMETSLTDHLAGGEAGMRHVPAQFGPALNRPRTRLAAPEPTQALADRAAAQPGHRAAGVSVRDLERRRDDCLVAVLSGLRGQDCAAGATVEAHERALRARAAPGDAAPLPTWTGAVLPEWIDYNGHMTEHRFLQCFGEATDALLRHVGVDAAYLAAKRSFYTVETHIMHRGEAREGEALAIHTQVLGADDKRLHVFHRFRRAADGAELASAEQMLLHVDAAAGRSVPAEGAVRSAVEALARSHAGLPRPEAAGRRVGASKG